MNKYDDARLAFRFLEINAETLATASIENQGMIMDSDMPLSFMDKLQNYHLASRLDTQSQEYMQLNSTVLEMFYLVTRGSRRRITNKEIAGIIEELEHQVNGYFEVRKAGKQKDITQYEGQVRQTVSALKDALISITYKFSEYVRNKFSTVNNLAQRIRENKKAISDFIELNETLDLIKLERLSEISRQDSTMSELLTRILWYEVNKCSKEFHDTLHRLHENLNALVDDEKRQQQNEMIDAMLLHYQKNPGYEPLLNVQSRLPMLFASVAPFDFAAHPPIDTDLYTDEQKLSDWAQEALESIKAIDKVEKKITTKHQAVKVEDRSDSTHIQELSPIQKALIEMFSQLPSLTRKAPVSSLYCLKYMQAKSGIKIDSAMWNMCVLNHYNASKYARTKEITATFVQTQLENYTGNFLVTDITFARQHA